MPWVRAHYRRPRRRRSDASGVLALLGVLALGALAPIVVAVITAVVTAIVAGADFVRSHWVELLVAAVVIASVPLGFGLWQWRRERSLARFLEAANDIAESRDTSSESVDAVVALRLAAGPLRQGALKQIEGLYRDAVAETVTDRAVSEQERHRLDDLQRAFGLDQQAATRAEVEGFLEAYSAIVADGRLSKAEEDQLEALRRALRVPEKAVEAQVALAQSLRDERLALEAQLRTAKQVSDRDLVPIDAGIKLKGGESCFYRAAFTEKKEKVARSYVVDGVRHTETAMETVRSGDLYVTDERVLLVADGTTTIKLAKVLDAAVEIESSLLVLTVDGRKTPYRLEVTEPFVAAAYVDKACAAG